MKIKLKMARQGATNRIYPVLITTGLHDGMTPGKKIVETSIFVRVNDLTLSLSPCLPNGDPDRRVESASGSISRNGLRGKRTNDKIFVSENRRFARSPMQVSAVAQSDGLGMPRI
ncbi:hypothetical protein JW906_05475 [bacterium]|nr:hypothetical protein [bacterium]